VLLLNLLPLQLEDRNYY